MCAAYLDKTTSATYVILSLFFFLLLSFFLCFFILSFSLSFFRSFFFFFLSVLLSLFPPVFFFFFFFCCEFSASWLINSVSTDSCLTMFSLPLKLVSYFSWCVEPSQPQRCIPGFCPWRTLDTFGKPVSGLWIMQSHTCSRTAEL